MEFSLKLISLVKEKPEIYKYRTKTEKAKANLDELWKEIASEMNSTDQKCKQKWGVLRNCYARLLRVQRNQRNSSNKQNERTWYLESELSFLKRYIKPHAVHSSKKSAVQWKQDYSMEIESSSSPPPIENFLSIETSNDSTVSTQSKPIQFSNASDETHPTESQVKNDPQDSVIYLDDLLENESNSSTITIETSLSPYAKPSNEPVLTPQNTDQTGRSNYLFLTSLLPDLNKLPEKKQRIFKRKTIELLEVLFDDDVEDMNSMHAQTMLPYTSIPTYQLPAYNCEQSEEIKHKVEWVTP